MNIIWNGVKLVFIVGSVIQTHQWMQRQHWYQANLIRVKIAALKGAAGFVNIVTGRKDDDSDVAEGENLEATQ